MSKRFLTTFLVSTYVSQLQAFKSCILYCNLQKTALTYHIETLKREIQSALHDRDKALKECHDLQERFGEFTAKEESQREGYKSRFEYAYSRERLVITNFVSMYSVSSSEILTVLYWFRLSIEVIKI